MPAAVSPSRNATQVLVVRGDHLSPFRSVAVREYSDSSTISGAGAFPMSPDSPFSTGGGKTG